MSSSSLLDQQKFWDVINYLMNIDQKKSFDQICEDLKITKHQLNSFIHFLKEVNCNLEYHCENGTKGLKAPEQLPSIKVEFTLLEWLQFQANFPLLSQNQEKPYFETIAKKLAKVERQYGKHELFTPLEKLESTQQLKLSVIKGQSHFNHGVLEFLEEAILDKEAVLIQIDEKKHALYPRLIVFIDGNLGLIAEAIEDHCLVKIDLGDIATVCVYNHSWEPTFSKFEIDEFVLGLRAIGENEVRLILKVFSQEHFHLELKHQLFGSPCMVTNPSGELIWAASVEPSNTIFEWIYQLGNSVEILDPNSFKKEYLRYCESKLKKLA